MPRSVRPPLHSLLRYAAMGVLGLAASLSASSRAQDVTSLPGGATSLRETHGEWTVTCGVQAERRKVCAFFQQQVDGRSHQQVLAIELQPEKDGVRGTLVLPFGLALEKGVRLEIDKVDLGRNLRFRTCLPRGCLVPIDFDLRTVSALSKGNVLKVVGTVADGGKTTAFSIPLKGFARARERTAELLR